MPGGMAFQKNPQAQCWAVLVRAEPLLLGTHRLVPRLSGGSIVITRSGKNLVLRAFCLKAPYLVYVVDSFKHKHSERGTNWAAEKMLLYDARAEPGGQSAAHPPLCGARTCQAARGSPAQRTPRPQMTRKPTGSIRGQKQTFSE